jgi:UPF0271 protein
MAPAIDLNADLGEAEGEEAFARDEAILSFVTSCSVACGGHAGDGESMRRTLRAAKAAGVAAGAHPSYPDRENFGRKSLSLPMAALEETLEAQIGALFAAAAEEGVTLRHLKPHGALYNDAARDEALAALIARLAARHGLALYGQPDSAAEMAAAAEGVPFAAEGFADRAYDVAGRLVPRTEPGAVITDEAVQAAQAVALAKGDPVATKHGTITVRARTLCLHSDTPGAAASAKRLRGAGEQAGLLVEAPFGV